MPSRKDIKKQKEKTSQALIDAALELCSNEGYASLSLRSVARKAGIAPTSFYRHFREIDEMGVEMALQGKQVMSDCLTQARDKMAFPAIKKNDSPAQALKSIERITRPFTETFIHYMKKNNRLLHLFFQERTGSSEAMRRTIAEATDQLTDLLADGLEQIGEASKNNFGDVRLIAETMLSIAGASGMEMLVHPEIKPADVIGQTIGKLNLLLLGALTMEPTNHGDDHE